MAFQFWFVFMKLIITNDEGVFSVKHHLAEGFVGCVLDGMDQPKYFANLENENSDNLKAMH